MYSIASLTNLSICRRPLRSLFQIPSETFLTIDLDVEVDDDVILWYLNVVRLMSIDILQRSANVGPSELRRSTMACLLSRALHENSVE